MAKLDRVENIDGRFVAAYRNLTRKCLSVMEKGRVIAHRDAIVLESVTFVVHESGRGRVIESGRKNVHAYAMGRVLTDARSVVSILAEHAPNADGFTRVTYNPRVYSTFVDYHTEQRVRYADLVIIDQFGHMWAKNAR